jgi:hypothetical protein
MTAAEAIQKTIDREKKELAGLEDEEKRLWTALENAATDEARREVAEQLIRVMRMILHREDYEQEIEGKKAALAAVNADRDHALRAIDREIAAENEKAMEHARKAQELREQALRDQQQGHAEQAKTAREQAARLSHEFDLELARLRGKREARRAVERTLAS